jgi:DNA-binding NarL/FixJ family response regulator
MNARPRLLIVDDHRMFAEALRGLLAGAYELLEIVEDGTAMVEAALRLRPDAIVADISMPGMNGLEALVQLRRMQPEARVVFLTMHNDVAYARRAIAAGARGFVLKHSAAAELQLALRSVLDGKVFITSALAGEVVPGATDPSAPADPVSAITPRQREILQLVADGQSAKQVAARLGISVRTVEFHKYAVMEAVGARNTAELIRFASRHGIVSA